MATKVIAIAANGHGVGKSTLADFIEDALERQHNVECCRESFASCLKLACEQLIGAKPVFCAKDKPCKALNGHAPRELLIKLGEMIKKEFDSAFFVKKIISEIYVMPNDHVVIIDDMRFPVELNMLRDTFGDNLTAIFLEGKVDKDAQDSSTECLFTDEEVFLDFDLFTNNYGNIVDLYDKAVRIAELIVNGK